jgi:hypothetical protein
MSAGPFEIVQKSHSVIPSASLTVEEDRGS